MQLRTVIFAAFIASVDTLGMNERMTLHNKNQPMFDDTGVVPAGAPSVHKLLRRSNGGLPRPLSEHPTLPPSSQGMATLIQARGPSPGPAQGPAGVTQADCDTLLGTISAVSCEAYAFELGVGAGCACFLDGAGCPPPPGPPFTGGVLAEAPVNKPEMGSVTRTTCFYRQWLQDPSLFAEALKQEMADGASYWMKDVYSKSKINGENKARPLWSTFQTTTTPPPITTQAYWWATTIYSPYPAPAPSPYPSGLAPAGPVAAPAAAPAAGEPAANAAARPAAAGAVEPAVFFFNPGRPSDLAGHGREVTAEVFPRFGGHASSGGFVAPRAPNTFR